MKARSLVFALAMNAHAKINLTLEVLARRDDGYHALRSVMVPIALADDLTFERSERFAFDCEPRSLLRDNLVERRAGTARPGRSADQRDPAQAYPGRRRPRRRIERRGGRSACGDERRVRRPPGARLGR